MVISAKLYTNWQEEPLIGIHKGTELGISVCMCIATDLEISLPTVHPWLDMFCGLTCAVEQRAGKGPRLLEESHMAASEQSWGLRTPQNNPLCSEVCLFCCDNVLI